MVEFRIGKSLFDQGLAIIKFGIQRQHPDVFPQRGHLLPLAVGDFSPGKQHHEFYIVKTVKGIGNRTPCIA